MSKFSVIVPVYNVAPYLRECLDSLILAKNKLHEHPNPQIRNWEVEIICVDDGSTDGSPKILDDYKEQLVLENKNFSFQVVRQTNRGPSSARNRGLELMTGDYVLFLDSDDTVVDIFFVYLAEKLREECLDILRFGCVKVNSHDDDIEPEFCDLTVFDVMDTKKAWAVFAIMMSMFACTGCFSSKLVKNVRYVENLRPGEDVVFVTEAFVKSKKVATTSTTLYKYLQRAGSTMHQDRISVAYVLNHMQASFFIYGILKRWCIYPYIKKGVFKQMRSTFIGQCGLFIQKVDGQDYGKIWNNYFLMGRAIFCDADCALPKFFGSVYKWVFETEIPFFWKLFLFYPWRLRVFLLKFSRVSRIRDWVRGT